MSLDILKITALSFLRRTVSDSRMSLRDAALRCGTRPDRFGKILHGDAEIVTFEELVRWLGIFDVDVSFHPKT